MLWRKERKGECRRSVSEPALWMKAQRCTLRTCTGEKKEKAFFWFLNVHLSIHQWAWLQHSSWTCVKVTGVAALILWLWYFSWIAEHTMNVSSVDCSFLGGAHLLLTSSTLNGFLLLAPRSDCSDLHITFICHSAVFFSLFSLCLSGIVTQRHNPSRINKFFIIHLAAVGRFSQPCTLAGYEASPPWYPRELWFGRRRSGRWALGWDWPGPAQRGLP